MEMKEVEMLKNSILQIVIENRFVADEPCTDFDVMQFLQDINEGKDKTMLVISTINWSWHSNQQNYSSVCLYAVKLPDLSYYITLEHPDLENEEDRLKSEYILRL